MQGSVSLDLNLIDDGLKELLTPGIVKAINPAPGLSTQAFDGVQAVKGSVLGCLFLGSLESQGQLTTLPSQLAESGGHLGRLRLVLDVEVEQPRFSLLNPAQLTLEVLHA